VGLNLNPRPHPERERLPRRPKKNAGATDSYQGMTLVVP